MHLPLLVAVLALPLAPLVSAQTVYKCVGDNGRTILQQAPCTGGKRIEVQVNDVGGPPRITEAEARQSQAIGRRESAIGAGLHTGYPVVGMNQEQLAQVLGQPDHINTSDYGRGIEEQRIYERNQRTVYVYTANGLVRAIQNNESSKSKKEPCPTSTDIRNLETTASSITLVADEKKELMRQIAKMKACR